MKLLLLCLLFGAVLAQTTDDNELSEAEHGENGERAKRCAGTCDPGHWCPRGGRRYIFKPTARTWAEAHAHCLELRSTLATVHNTATENFLKALSQGNPTWIGFSDAQHKGHWFWINGKKKVFANWCHGEPNNHGGNQACALINFSGNKCWDDQNCMTRLPYICEQK